MRHPLYYELPPWTLKNIIPNLKTIFGFGVNGRGYFLLPKYRGR